jgi:RimJ/RimL family protein N-acetyltransferase
VGQGFATEAAHALLHLAFDHLGLHRVVARIIASNVASVRVAGRLGMRREAHFLSNQWFKGAWVDEVHYALLADEWIAMHGGDPVPLASEAESAPRSYSLG